ncbi:hypothetical protein [Gemmatimonas sp.]|uniref:hypothetical protein n=1 Tax=Gemmatimonas sp. TaxID=1962908 RepID=UPI003DA26CCB
MAINDTGNYHDTPFPQEAPLPDDMVGRQAFTIRNEDFGIAAAIVRILAAPTGAFL